MRFLVLPAVFSLLALVIACGGAGEGGDLEVTLSEWSVVLDQESLPEGPITFDITNDGEREHELVIVRTDIPAGELPTNEDGSFDEDSGGVDVEREVEDIEAGEETSRSYSLDPDNYVLLCNIVEEIDGEEVSHFAMGMWAPFEVTEEE